MYYILPENHTVMSDDLGVPYTHDRLIVDNRESLLVFLHKNGGCREAHFAPFDQVDRLPFSLISELPYRPMPGRFTRFETHGE